MFNLLRTPEVSHWNDFQGQEIYDFIGLFEEIALMINSKFIRKGIVGYMFGFYVTLIIKVKKIRDEIGIEWIRKRDN